MAEFTAVTPKTHAKKVWKNVTDYLFAAADTVIPLVGAELNKVVPVMPVGFIKQEAGYQLVGITSLQPGQNLYVAPDGKWLGTYIPAALRAYPFLLLKPENAEKSILCVNEGSGLVVESTEGGNAFFDEQNQPTQGIKDILNLLSEVEANLLVTQGAVDALDEAGLIVPWKLNLKKGEEVVPVEGLFRVDEAALNELDDEDFLTLRKAGGLALAYGQLFSMNQLAVLEQLGKLRGQILAQQAANSNSIGFSLSEDEGSLMFD
ncbi:MAG: SapC family protein [Proteobacteria bacterium]|nr:SapC family protein [Pseudomonadota bacterium]